MSILGFGEGRLLSRCEADTLSLGESMGQALEPGEALLLVGDLGSGKTCFTRGVALGVDVPAEERVRSPSFTLINVYSGRIHLAHVDLYRLQSNEVPGLALEEIWEEDQGMVVEWAERLAGSVPPRSLWVRFEHLSDPSERLIRWGIRDPGP